MSTEISATQSEKMEAALQYLAKGYSIIPIGKRKKPIIPWKEYQTRSATADEVKGWFAEYPHMDIGIVTGKISRIVVVDVEAGGSTENLSPTVISQTGGGGYHFFYKHPGKYVKNQVRLRDKMDIRGMGAMS